VTYTDPTDLDPVDKALAISLMQILDHHTDGTTRWCTRDGQTGVTPPRPYLPETSPPDRPPDDEPCPY
jgi:hypothetical protein